MIDTIKKRIQEISPLDKEAWEDLEKILEIFNFKANHILLTQNEIAKHLYYVVKGILKSYYYKNGKEIVHWFGFENDIVTSLSSLITQQNSFENIKLIEDSTLICINFEKFIKLTKKHHSISHLYSKLLVEYFLLIENENKNKHFLKAKERYNILLKNYPAVLQRVSLGDVASYLGITQETLSRIRAGK